MDNIDVLIGFLSTREGRTIGYGDITIIITVKGNRMEYDFKEYEVHGKQSPVIPIDGVLVHGTGDHSIYYMGYSIYKLSCYL